MGAKQSKSNFGQKRKNNSGKRAKHINQNAQLKNVNRQLSCMSQEKRTKRTAGSDRSKQYDASKGHELAEHLRRITPFNGRWLVTKTINEGTYGVVFDAFDNKTKVQGVIKVAKSMLAGNQTTEWESFLLERIFRDNNDANVVRILDRGMLADQDGNGMEFVVLEKAQLNLRDWLDEPNVKKRQLKVLDIAMQMLKAIYDLHELGLLHRDLKPDNMGVYSEEQPSIVLFDLGMSRMYTDGVGGNRCPRTVVPFRGTPEWASGHAQKGREQSRYDDLIAWLYVIVELMDPNPDTNQPLPWTYRSQPKPLAFLKSNYCPAKILLKHCPIQFYSIYSYLMSASRAKPPAYTFIADRLKEARENHEAELALQTQTNDATKKMDQCQASDVTNKGGSILEVTAKTAPINGNLSQISGTPNKDQNKKQPNSSDENNKPAKGSDENLKRKSAEKIKGTPEISQGTPDKGRCTPDKGKGSAESGKKSAEKANKSPEKPRAKGKKKDNDNGYENLADMGASLRGYSKKTSKSRFSQHNRSRSRSRSASLGNQRRRSAEKLHQAYDKAKTCEG